MILKKIHSFDLKSLLAKIKTACYRRKLYNLTVSELSKLNDRELADMGINRCEIRNIAREHSHQAEINDNLRGWV